MDILWVALAVCVIVGFFFVVLARHWQRLLVHQSWTIRRLTERIASIEEVADPNFRRKLDESAPSPLERVYAFSFRNGGDSYRTSKIPQTDSWFAWEAVWIDLVSIRTVAQPETSIIWGLTCGILMLPRLQSLTYKAVMEREIRARVVENSHRPDLGRRVKMPSDQLAALIPPATHNRDFGCGNEALDMIITSQRRLNCEHWSG